MLTVDQIKSLDVGDEIILDPFVKGMSPEPTKLSVVLVVGDSVTFAAKWHGVHLGFWTGTVVDLSVTWSYL